MSKAAIATALHELGIPSGLLGYAYLAHGIAMVLEDRNMIRSITRGIYPAVAQKFNSTPSRVERAIRNAIETAWVRAPVKVQDVYFGNSVSPEMGRPTNREFIAAVAEHIRAT